MKTASSHPVVTSLTSVAGGVLVLFLFLALRGIWPLGGNTLEFMDNGQMIYPFLKHLASSLFSGVGDGAFFYDINAGAGIRVSPSLPHQLLIPSTWVAVAMGDAFMLKDMVWVMLVNVACICLTASWFLRRVFPSLPVFWNVLLTVCYAMGGFVWTKYSFMQFMDHAAIFPVFALGLYQMVNGGRGWLYAVGLFLLATSMYSAFMSVVLGWLFAWAYTLPMKGTQERRDRLGRVFWYTAAIVLATCYYWLPMMEMSRGSMRSLFMTPPQLMEWLWPFEPDQLSTRLCTLLPGMVPATLVFVCLFTLWKERKKRKPLGRGMLLFLLLLAACLLAVFVEPVHRAAHLWSYVCFPVRFGFIPNLVIIAFCSWLLTEGGVPLPKSCREGFVKKWWLWLVAVFGVSSIVLLWPVTVSALTRPLPLLFFPFAWLAWRHFEGRRLMWSMAVLAPLSLAVGIAAFWKPGSEETAAIQCENADCLAQSRVNDRSLLRVKDADRMMVDNAACLGHIPSVSNFRHTTSGIHFRFMKNLGYRDEFTRTFGQGGTLFSDQVLGNGFVLKSRRVEGVTPVWEECGMFLYALPEARWCHVVPQGALGLKLDEKASVFDNLNSLYAALCPEADGPLYVPVPVRVNFSGSGYEMLIPPHQGAVYGMPQTRTHELKVNDLDVPIMAAAGKIPGRTGILHYNGSLQLKREGVAGETRVTGVMLDPVEMPMEVVTVHGRECLPPLLPQGWKERVIDARGHGGHVEIRLPAAENEALLLPVVHDRGWSAVRNGSPVDIEKVGELMAVRLLPGENVVVFDYFPPLLKQSLIFSIVAAGCFLLYAWWARLHPDSAVRQAVLVCGFRLFGIFAFAVIAAVYVGSILLFMIQALVS